jgi:hypothetical protein
MFVLTANNDDSIRSGPPEKPSKSNHCSKVPVGPEIFYNFWACNSDSASPCRGSRNSFFSIHHISLPPTQTRRLLLAPLAAHCTSLSTIENSTTLYILWKYFGSTAPSLISGRSFCAEGRCTYFHKHITYIIQI